MIKRHFIKEMITEKSQVQKPGEHNEKLNEIFLRTDLPQQFRNGEWHRFLSFISHAQGAVKKVFLKSVVLNDESIMR